MLIFVSLSVSYTQLSSRENRGIMNIFLMLMNKTLQKLVYWSKDFKGQDMKVKVFRQLYGLSSV